MIKRILFVLCGLMVLVLHGNAQDAMDPNAFDGSSVVQAVVAGINDARWRLGLDSVLVKSELTKAATKLAGGYVDAGKVAMDPEDASHEAKKAGATTKVQEVAIDVSTGKGKSYLSYDEISKDALDKLVKNKKFDVVIKNPKHCYIGVAAKYNDGKKKVYIDVVMGGIDAFNAGAKDRKKLKLKYTKSKKGLDQYDAKYCKACEKFPDLQSLYDSVKIEGRKVYMYYGDWKKFKKYFRNKGDGLAVEFLQRKQYPCIGNNIYDNNKNTKGFLFRPIYQEKLFSRNETLKDNPKTTTYKGYIAKIPKRVIKKIDPNYEMNLYFILNHTICKVMNRQYLDHSGDAGIAPLAFYPDSLTSIDPKPYVPKSENQTLEFVVPFQQNKTDYNAKDIQAILDTLKEPSFVINEINIQANSSMEGDSLINAKLQSGRAQSIIDALGKIQNKKIIGKIVTSDSWDMFEDQIKANPDYKEWIGLSKDDVKKKLQGAGAAPMEPVLSKERFATLELKVTYDFSGPNEEQFVVNSLRKALAKKDVETARRISRFIVQQIIKKRYGTEKFLALEIPPQSAYAPIMINQMFIDNKFNHADSIYPELVNKVDALYGKYANDDFVAWNDIRLLTKSENAIEVKDIIPTQNRVNQLYSGRIPQRINDALNLEFQFKIIEKVDTAGANQPNDALKASMDRIKKIFNLDAANWQNALKLAVVFQQHGDLAFAKKLLEPYLTDEDPNENLLFTYIAIAAHFPDEIYGRNFRIAMSRAKDKNKDRFCKLFGAPYLSFQILNNPTVKHVYCDNCGNGQ